MEFDVRPGHHRGVHREVPSTMTNQPTERLRSGRAPGRWGSGDGGGVRFGLVLIGLLAGVLPTFLAAETARAAEVVEVRVGRHPDFTRVVFELDRSAGYRIERSDPSAKEAELIISLEAGSIPRRIQSSQSFIEQVVVEPSGTRSIARIRLARGGLRLKEMILASPPRIVLDVIAEKDATTVAAQSARTPAATKTAAATPSSPPKPTPSATPTPAAPPAPKPTAVIANAAPATKPAPTPAATPSPSASPTSSPKTRVLATTEDPNAKTPRPAPAPSAQGTPPADALAAAGSGDAGGSDAPNEWNDGGATDSQPGALAADSADAADASADAAAGEEPAKARPMMVKSSDSEDAEGGGLVTWSLAGVGLLVAAFGGLVVARRRRAAAELDEDEDDEEASDDDDETEDEEEEESSTSASSNPFAELTGGSASLASGMTRSGTSPARSAEKVADKPEKKPSESLLFDDAEEKTMEGMEVISRAQVNESLGGAMPMMGAGSDELTQMFREMQRRVAALEGRIDELVDARDRLERQVAAQTEELRVQRAAIARTQRAVRNLARPEEGSDDEPTEPALRDPN
jgi:outer membrane biosynthesis protein TonB